LTERRVATGVDGFDKVNEGGFPKCSLIVLVRAPGTGKTTFASQYVYFGANHASDNPIYVSFMENEEQFVENQLKHFGHVCNECLGKKGCKFLDFTAVKKEGIPLILEEMLKAIRNYGAKRLLIDSFSAMSQALNEKIESRIIGHTMMNKIVRQMSRTTLLIMEMPTGTDGIGEGVEEFVSDGVIILRKIEKAGYLMRDLETPR
jgi:circadian clock protein KaiC